MVGGDEDLQLARPPDLPPKLSFDVIIPLIDRSFLFPCSSSLARCFAIFPASASHTGSMASTLNGSDELSGGDEGLLSRPEAMIECDRLGDEDLQLARPPDPPPKPCSFDVIILLIERSLFFSFSSSLARCFAISSASASSLGSATSMLPRLLSISDQLTRLASLEVPRCLSANSLPSRRSASLTAVQCSLPAAQPDAGFHRPVAPT